MCFVITKLFFVNSTNNTEYEGENLQGVSKHNSYGITLKGEVTSGFATR